MRLETDFRINFVLRTVQLNIKKYSKNILEYKNDITAILKYT